MERSSLSLSRDNDFIHEGGGECGIVCTVDVHCVCVCTVLILLAAIWSCFPN